ncbi:CdaR family protein [Rhinopithecimicrobium faecis]
MNKSQKRKLAMFAKCMLISFLAWTFFAVSNEYTYQMRASLDYVNLPENKAFHPQQSDTVSLKVSMTGWQVLMTKFQNDTPKVQVDLSGLKNRNWIVFSNQIGFINRQFPSEKRVLAVRPDTLYFDFSKQSQKKVPIKPITSIQFKKQFDIIDDILISPKYVTISGPNEDVAKIEYIETDTIRGTNVSVDIRTASYLNKAQRTNINFYPSNVQVVVPIGEMTEKILEVPLKVVNAEKFTSVRTLPSKVTLTLLVSIKDYNKWTPRDFEAAVDLENWEDNQVQYLPVLITKVPKYCKVLSVEPQNIDFFVRK